MNGAAEHLQVVSLTSLAVSECTHLDVVNASQGFLERCVCCNIYYSHLVLMDDICHLAVGPLPSQSGSVYFCNLWEVLSFL